MFNQGDKDFTALVSKLKLNNIDIVYDGGYHQEAGLIVRQMRDQGLKTILMSGDALASREFASITGPAGEGVLFTFPPDPRKRATAAAIVKEFKDKGVDPEGYVLYTYAAFQVWAQAAAKAGTLDARRSRRSCAPEPGTRCSVRFLRQERRYHRWRLGRLSLGQERQLRGNHRGGTS